MRVVEGVGVVGSLMGVACVGVVGVIGRSFGNESLRNDKRGPEQNHKTNKNNVALYK